MGKSFLAFDLGASSGRGIIGKITDGKLTLNEVHRFNNFPVEEGGHFNWDLNAIFNEIKTGIKKAYAADPEIASISIDTWGVDYALFRNGKLVRNPFCYRDSRTNGLPEELKKLVSAEELYSICGLQTLVFNTIYQLYAHKRDFPQDFENDTTMLLMPDALLYLLTGDISSEYTIASTSALLDANTRVWSKKLIEQIGLPKSLFCGVVPPSKSLPLQKSICDELGVPAIPTVKCASHDTGSAIAAVPLTANGKKWAYISTGTWALLGAELPSPVLEDKARQASFTNEGGVAGIRFLTNIMGTWLLQETRRNWVEAGRNISFPEMIEMAKEVKNSPFRIDPNCQDFLSPCDMPAKIRDYCERTGQGAIRSDEALVRCIYDSLADCFKLKLDILENLLGYQVELLHVFGGAIRDELLMQLAADATKRTVVAGPAEATAIGNILMQMILLGEIDSLETGRQLVADSFGTKTFSPQK